MPQQDNLTTFQCFGLDIKNGTDKEATSNCPFCDTDNKLFIRQDEGLFDCKVCGASGNKYTFLQLWYTHCLDNTGSKQYQSLSQQRGRIPKEAFSSRELAWDQDNRNWLIPVRNEKGSMVNPRRS